MISVAQAQRLIEEAVVPLADETITPVQAFGRILREPISAPADMPAFDHSAVDGYAIRGDENATELELVGEIRAGQAIGKTLQPGEAIRILTGARLPGPGLKIVMQEQVEIAGSRIRLLQPGSANYIRAQGTEAREGEVLLESGTLLGAAALALIASLGRTALRVPSSPRIFHLTTGDEIIPPEQVPKPGQIRNSNASLISALCREQGIENITHRHAGDDWPALQQLVAEAKTESFDLILISGGSGAGDYDFSARLFQHLGVPIQFRQVNVRPGKPLIFGTTASQVIFGLPGNVLSHFVCFHLFVRRALDRLLGRATSGSTQGFLQAAMKGTTNDRETWWPAQARLEEGRLVCGALPWKSSGDITRLPGINALIQVLPMTHEIPAETKVNLLLTRSL